MCIHAWIGITVHPTQMDDNIYDVVDDTDIVDVSTRRVDIATDDRKGGISRKKMAKTVQCKLRH